MRQNLLELVSEDVGTLIEFVDLLFNDIGEVLSALLHFDFDLLEEGSLLLFEIGNHFVELSVD